MDVLAAGGDKQVVGGEKEVANLRGLETCRGLTKQVSQYLCI